MSREKVIYVLGDVCPAWGFPKDVTPTEPERVFHELLPLFSEAEYVVCNLESPATGHKTKLVKNSVCLKALPEDLDLLFNAGIKAVALANNHILDYEERGLSDTLKRAGELGLGVYGAGTQNDAAAAYYIEAGGYRVGFIAFAEEEFNCASNKRMGANRWSCEESLESIRNAARDCDFLVVQYHGGIEHHPYPSPELRHRCRLMARAGAGLVTCQHSHCIGTREFYEGCEVLYGQGNSVFGFRERNESWNRGLVVRLHLGEEVRVDYLPIVARQDGTHLADGKLKEEILTALEQESEKLDAPYFVEREWQAFCARQADMYLPMLLGWGRVMNKLNRLSKGALVKLLTNRSARRTMMNLIRCDSHREVLTTVLESEAD